MHPERTPDVGFFTNSHENFITGTTSIVTSAFIRINKKTKKRYH